MADDDIPDEDTPNDDILGGDILHGDILDQDSDRDPHRDKQRKDRETRVITRFKTSQKGLRRVFGKHFGDENADVETLSYHLASAEAKLPNIKQAIRLARYPGAGDRDAKRFAMGLWENLSVLSTHLHRAMDSLEGLAQNRHADADADSDD